MTENKVLVVGNSVLDVINICEHYPVEDEKVRASKCFWAKGGNAANSSQVLSQLSVEVDLLSSMAKNMEGEFVKTELEKSGVDVQKYCVFHDHSGFPTSCSILAASTGSRTIIHARNGLPEVRFKDFKRVDISQYHWIHFEGRGFPDVSEMIKYARDFRKPASHCLSNPGDLKCTGPLIPKLSVEIENPRRSKELIEQLLPYADIAFISKDVASHIGYKSSKDTVMNIKKDMQLNSDMVIICAWGKLGADAIDQDGTYCHSDSFPPKKVIDTLGAGDTFNAAVISLMLKERSLNEAISFGCKLAGRKCGQIGFQNLTN